MRIKLNKKNIIGTLVGLLLIVVLVRADIPNTLAFKVENSTQDVFTVDMLGHVNATGNIETDQDLYVHGSMVCTDCIGDEDVSNTLTASDLQAGSEVVTDSEVVNTLTIDGGTISLMTNTYSGTLGYGNITLCANDKILKTSGGAWTCADDATGDGGGGNTTEEVQAAINVTDDYYDIKVKESADLVCTDCIGTTEISDDYVLNAGDNMDGDLGLSNADINLNVAGQSNITDTNSNSYFYFDANGGLVVHLEA
jgi:hypothetical protein